MPVINCADCGAERKARNKNTKYCTTCRLLRDLWFIGPKPYHCQECKQPYSPLRRGDLLCAQCDVFDKELPAQREECRTCGESEYRLLADDIRMCRKCAKKPELRRGLIQRLREKVEATSGTTEAT